MAMSGVGFRSERGPVLIALMVTTFVVAVNTTILATAVPTIVADLGGFAQFPWLFSIFLLGQSVSVPVFSKLSDIAGRKPIVLLGLALFLLSSVLCAIAWSMPSLILFRALQGIAAGAVQPLAVAIAGDIYTVVERAKVQGYIASVWALSSVAGPTLGGLLSEFSSWRLIFAVNVPLCLVAAGLLIRNFDERALERRRRPLDLLGAALLTAALSLLILGLLQGGQSWGWVSPPGIGVFALGGALLLCFAAVERRAADPVVPLWTLTRRLLLTTTLVGIGIGAVLIGLVSFVPSYLEGSLGVSPLVAGLAIGVLTIGWPIAASQAGRLYLRFGYRASALLGSVIVLLGAVVLASTAGSPSLPLVALSCFVVGLGLGLTATPSLVAAQASVPRRDRGVVTGVNLFARSAGSAIGVAVFGAIANAVIAAAPGDGGDPAALIAASGAVFVAVTVVALTMVAAAIAMPGGVLAPAGEPDEVDPVTPGPS